VLRSAQGYCLEDNFSSLFWEQPFPTLQHRSFKAFKSHIRGIPARSNHQWWMAIINRG